ncbi:MAG TPA: hypothetical protein VNV25_20365 [Gemmatimonadaceae bacterium]|jgi:hypothetical protein|nr:hypothetical protein [Gemmatimonadaceae bacterium]
MREFILTMITLNDRIFVTRYQWERWFWTCIFALLPLFVWLLLVQIKASRELLFFSLAICTLDLSELRKVDPPMRNRYGYESLCSASVMGIVVSAALYGVFLSVQGDPKALTKIFVFSVGVALAGVVVGTRAQIFIHRGDTNAGSA